MDASGKYLLPRKLNAEVRAIISACAVGSFRRSTWLCPRAIILLLMTTTAPTGTSPSSNARRASLRACCIKYSSFIECMLIFCRFLLLKQQGTEIVSNKKYYQQPLPVTISLLSWLIIILTIEL